MPVTLVGTPLPVASGSAVAPQQSLETSAWRVVSKRPLFVRSDVDEKKGVAVCDLFQGSRVAILEQSSRPDGTIRALIIDPVWMGWLTLKSKLGAANLEPIAAPPPEAADVSDTPAADAATNVSESAASVAAAPTDESLPPSDALVVVEGSATAVAQSAEALDKHASRDPNVERVLHAANEFETLDLPIAPIDNMAEVRKLFRRISLVVHPDKNDHPQATAAFRKVFGAFNTLCDTSQQKRRLVELQAAAVRATLSKELSEIQEAVDRAGNGDEEDEDEDEAREEVEWWREASVEEMDMAAEEAEGADMDALISRNTTSAGSGGSVDVVRWIGTRKAIAMQRADRAIFIDCREPGDFAQGSVPGAYNVPMSLALSRRGGIVDVMGKKLIETLKLTKPHALLVIYSNVATPFSRDRAFCRLLLSAAHQTLHPLRLRRLRGGIVGWRRRGGELKS